MRRPKSFAELQLPRIGVWPVDGYKLLDFRGERQSTATLGGDGLSWFTALSHGYKLAGDILVEQASEGSGHPNFLIYPILFCYRQFIELSLKGLLAQYGPSAMIKPMWNSHKLPTLWKTLEEALNHHSIPDDETRRTVRDQIKQLADFDPNSETSRYHVDNKGNPIILNIDHIDITRLEKGLDALASYFVYLIENGPDEFP